MSVLRAIKVIIKGVAVWRHFKPWQRLKQRRHRRRNTKRAKKGLPPLPDNEEETMDVLPGKKTWIGIAAVLAGVVLKLLGFGECAPTDAACVPADTLVQMFVAALDQVFLAAGSVMTLWGVAMKEIRERKLKAQLENIQAPPQ